MTLETARDSLFNAEIICTDLQCGIVALDAIHTAMAEGPDDPETYIDGLRCITEYLRDRRVELSAVIHEAIKDGGTVA